MPERHKMLQSKVTTKELQKSWLKTMPCKFFWLSMLFKACFVVSPLAEHLLINSKQAGDTPQRRFPTWAHRTEGQRMWPAGILPRFQTLCCSARTLRRPRPAEPPMSHHPGCAPPPSRVVAPGTPAAAAWRPPVPAGWPPLGVRP